MSVRRALVSCAVLGVQDACVFYPCCKSCFSRIDVEPRDTTRCRCSRCGYTCLGELVDYRYRLSLRVTRDRCIFGVTVFGTCLNPFFGIHASGLQRLVENVDGPVAPSVRAKLLIRAVEDCFRGKHFIFGIKLSGTDGGLYVGEPELGKDRVQFIASQMILPKGAGLGGCTVLTLYQLLLQKAAEYDLGSSDPGKTFRHPETPLLLTPHRSPARSFNDATLSASGFVSMSPQRSQDSTLIPTPPWQQSLGLVTSSAEQDEGSSSQDNEDQNSQQTDDNKTAECAQISCRGMETARAETTLSSHLSLEDSPHNSPSFANHTYTSIEESVGNGPVANTWFSPSQPSDRLDSSPTSKAKAFSTRQSPKTFQCSSLLWEDLPLSESLAEFLCEEYKHFDMESNVQNQSEMVKNDTEVSAKDKNCESTSVHHSSTEGHSRLGDVHGLSEHMCEEYVVCVNKSKDGNQDNKEAGSRSFENKEEQLEGDAYDCSVDLFGSSLTIDKDSMAINTPPETLRVMTETYTLLSNPDQQQLKRENCNVTHLTPDKLKKKGRKSFSRDSFIPPGIQDLEFIPRIQSTPVLKVNAVSGSPPSSYITSPIDSHVLSAFNCDLLKLDSRNPGQITSPLSKLSANQRSHCGKKSIKENLVWSKTSFTFTPKGRSWKPVKQKKHPLAQESTRIQAGALNLQSPVRSNHKCDSIVCDVTVCGCENSDIMVPPTPASKTQLRVKLMRRSLQNDLSGSRSGFTQTMQGHGVNCKRNLLDFSQKQPTQTGNCGTKLAEESGLDESNLCDDENQACDWSRDLFSDST